MFLNVLLGLWVAASPFLLDGGGTAAMIGNALLGLGLVALSLPRGTRSEEHYGGWDRYIVWLHSDQAADPAVWSSKASIRDGQA